ncbi:MAG: D-glycero-beta-D-manno-heptose 1-phosphate adenylyltransferase [Chlamydiae bacterium]|nr:D-glycero-beta-D-manno-heptose 1-phosphate adenylyltransferase [Chlamydiota bacterium]MBI3277711.1 D-glycero-beta-D-manno-heptose 1-phosphate adenylyltransferase [Chlamydiota bacterium]
MDRPSKFFLPLALSKKFQQFKEQGQKIVFTNGCFDLLHVGHVRILNQAKRLGDVLVVALNTDSSVRKLKGKKRPLVSLKERMEILSSLEAVDYVTSFSDETPQRIIQILNPDILVKGGDYKMDQVVGARYVKDQGGKVVILPFIKGRSSSDLLRKMKAL